MSELNKLDRMIDLTKDNINQLLWIGIHNNDGNIIFCPIFDFKYQVKEIVEFDI